MSEVASSDSGCVCEESRKGVRLVVLNLPEDEGEGLGFRLTRTLWDPYPWVREGRDSASESYDSGYSEGSKFRFWLVDDGAETCRAGDKQTVVLYELNWGPIQVTADSRADAAGLAAGDCLLQADGKDLLGMPVGQVAGLIRGDGGGGGVSLLVWSCGVDPRDDPELLWSCGGGGRGERARRALAGVVAALACCVCAATATRALHCARSHLYCQGCWSRLTRCALCREPLPATTSAYARNLVAEQVFEAIAREYEIKDTVRKPVQTSSAVASPNRSPDRSPDLSPATSRRGQYQLSMMNRRKKPVQLQLNEKYASDPNIHRSSRDTVRQQPKETTNMVENPPPGNSSHDDGSKIKCCCQTTKVPEIRVENCDKSQINQSNGGSGLPHRLVARLRPACSMADLQGQEANTSLSRSLNNISYGGHCIGGNLSTGSLDDLKKNSSISDCSPVFVLTPPPVYLVTCDHSN